MPGLIGLTLAGSRPLDAASVVARMQRLITHPRYNVAEPAVDDGLVCAARSHTGRGRGPAQPAAAGGRPAWLDGEIIKADELGRLLIHAVAERAQPEERVAVSLSGGLDSRAIVAATAPRDEALPAVTFGRPGCVDIAIARRVAALKGACHEVVSITSDNWLAPRFLSLIH